MSKQIDISHASVYVGTYRKYNEGSLFGKWLNLSDYSDIEEFYNACRELHNDEVDPEFMFQDYENVPEGLIDESWLSENTFEVLQALEDMNDDQLEAFLIWSSDGHHSLSDEDIDQLISSFEDDYIGRYDSEQDFARELIDDTGDLTDFVKQYFDYEAFARDLFCSDYWYSDGYVFRNS